jgi:hypothetical protein
MHGACLSLSVAGAALGLLSSCRATTPSASLADDSAVPAASADQGLALVQLVDESCSGGCHGDDTKVDLETLKRWADATKATKVCLDSKTDPAARVTDCIGSSGYSGLGMYRALAHDAFFGDMLRDAGTPAAQVTRFKRNAFMPRTSNVNAPGPFGDQAMAVVELFAAEAGTYVTLIKARPEASAGGSACVESITPELVAHLTGAENGSIRTWKQWHIDNKTPMYGCPERNSFPADPSLCLTDKPEKPEWANAAAGRLRLLRELPGQSSYWMRSSADGRFVGNGGPFVEGYSGAIDDLARAGRRIGISMPYDPAFTPATGAKVKKDWQRFFFVGTTCPLSLLEDAQRVGVDTYDPSTGCQQFDDIGTYQSVGIDLGNPDRMIVVAPEPYVADDGGRTDTTFSTPLAFGDSVLAIHSLAKAADGSGRTESTRVSVPMKGESQTQLSPSGMLVVNRFGSRGGESPSEEDLGRIGYRVRFLSKMQQAGVSYDGDLDETASTICMRGNKATSSFDDRFLVTHHFTDATVDAANAGRSSNINLFDLKTKRLVQITNMPVGSFALFPHFRADGWIYFLVREHRSGVRRDYIMASDAALKL